MFDLDESDAEMNQNLTTIESALRNQYWLVYRPAELKHDGLFHHIYVGTSDSAKNVTSMFAADTMLRNIEISGLSAIRTFRCPEPVLSVLPVRTKPQAPRSLL